LIFVTVGTCDLSFDRLIKQADTEAKVTDEKFIIQKGFSPYLPKHAEYFDFDGRDKMLDLISKADIVITHAGFGILGDCIKQNKRIIVVPREKKYNESVNPQFELAEYLAKVTTGVICIRDVKKLGKAINQIMTVTPSYHFTNIIPELIQNFINQRLS
jgi:UDP-N-acetylglucosamine transferase subunit ALG13